MMTYAPSIADRKRLVARLEALTGRTARYTFVPRCAYEIGAFTVERDGSMTAANSADPAIIRTLTEEGMIGALTHADEMPADVPPHVRAAATTEDWGDEEDVPEVGTPTAAGARGAAHDNGHDADETCEPTGFSFHLRTHTVRSLTNLICMIHSRGALLSKATGGAFFADKALVDAILDERTFRTVDELVAYVNEWGEEHTPLLGVSFDGDLLTFDGFGQAVDADHAQTFMRLAAAMDRMARTQDRVQAKDVDDSNERYSLRVWLIRLGMKGAAYKADRKRLMEHLSGHTAFRNEEERARWEAKQRAKREAAKACQNEEVHT